MTQILINMRLFLFILLISFKASSQDNKAIFFMLIGKSAATVSYDVDAQSYFTRLVAAGYTPTSGEKAGINTYILGLKSNSLWTVSYDELLFIGGSNSAASLVTLKGAVTPTAINSPTFSSNGVQGNGTSSYINTNIIPSTALTLNNTSLIVYSRTSATIGTSSIDAGSTNSSSQELSFVIRRSNGTSLSVAYNETTTAGMLQTTAITDGSGCFILSRTSTSNHFIMRNGATVATQTTSGGILPTRALYLCVTNAGTPVGFTARQYCFLSVGAGYTSANAAIKTTLINNLQTALGRNTF